MSFVLQLPRSPSPSGAPRPPLRWTVQDAAHKLRLRDGLPGAHVFDRVAEALKHAGAQGLSLRERLALALPASWMVNSKAPSPVMFAWASADALPAWELLEDRLGQGAAHYAALNNDDKREMAYALEALLVPPKGTVCALSKVLALLFPAVVPLLDDAAVALLTGAVEVPPGADQPSAGPELVVPALDAFIAAAAAQTPSLQALADTVGGLKLTPAQVLDRLLWFDSWGHRHFAVARVSGDIAGDAWAVAVDAPAAG